MKHPEVDVLIAETLQSADFQTTFQILQIISHYMQNDTTQKLFQLSQGEERYEALLQCARKRHGQLIDFIPPVMDELQRQNQIVQRRQFITGSDHRFFLALLLNIPERTKVLELIQQRFPDQAVMETLNDWMLELANTKVYGSDEPNLLGIPDFDEDYQFVLQRMMRGETKAQIQESVSQNYASDYAEDFARDVETIYERLQSSALFKGIFADVPAVLTESKHQTAP